jgi:hypothetical protein
MNEIGTDHKPKIIYDCIKEVSEKYGLSEEEICEHLSSDFTHKYILPEEVPPRTLNTHEEMPLVDNKDLKKDMKLKDLIGVGTTTLVFNFDKDNVIKIPANISDYDEMYRGVLERRLDLEMSKDYPDSFARSVGVEFIVGNLNHVNSISSVIQERLNMLSEEGDIILGNLTELSTSDKEIKLKQIKPYLKYIENPEEFVGMLNSRIVSGFGYNKNGFIKASDYD